MCEDCRHYPCITECPNYEENPVFTCDCCGNEIFDGEKYYLLDDIPDVKTLILCKECIDGFGRYAESEKE